MRPASLAGAFPGIAKEWHPTKNAPLTPRDVTSGTHLKAWWRCSRDATHVWCAQIAPRTARGVGCPFCAHRRVTPETSLAARFPAIAKEWHPTKNAPLTPRDVAPGTHLKAWWRCSRDPAHAWHAQIVSRTGAGRGCPICAGRLVTRSNSLRRLHPAIAALWHPTANGSLTPGAVTARSSRSVFWQCDAARSHVWRARISHHVDAEVGCPWCGGRKLTPSATLLVRFPDVAAEWHPTKNAPLTPARVFAHSERKVWWQCSRRPAHVWEQRIGNRARSGGCPICSGQRVAKSTSLRARRPALAKEWHPTLNGELGPGDVTPGSGRKVWWQCSTDPLHVWQAPIGNRAGQGTGCPACSGRVATPQTSLRARFPRIAGEWHPTKNDGLAPAGVRPGSARIVWWRCRRDPSHEWKTAVSHRTGPRKSACPMCSGRVATPATSLAAIFPEIAEQWHPTKNRRLAPGQLTPHSTRKVWWQCPREATHAWPAAVYSRTRGRTGCPLCAHKRVTPATSLAERFPALAAEWHPTKNGKLRADRVLAGGKRKVWWRCGADPAHIWQAAIGHRSGSGTGCPECKTLLAKRPDLAREWHPTRNGSVTPAGVSAGSEQRVWWRCTLNPAHEWRTAVQSRTRPGAGTGCPHCARLAHSTPSPAASLAAKHPELAREWHPTRNGLLTPATVFPGSGKKVWWRCKLNPAHEWFACVGQRSYGTGCPDCAHGANVRRTRRGTERAAPDPALAPVRTARTRRA